MPPQLSPHFLKLTKVERVVRLSSLGEFESKKKGRKKTGTRPAAAAAAAIESTCGCGLKSRPRLLTVAHKVRVQTFETYR